MISFFKSRLVAGAFFFAAMNLSAASGQPWSVERLTIPSFESSAKSAAFYLPHAAVVVSAIVMIINNREVANWVQNYYAPNLARGGVAVLIVQEIKPLDLRDVLEPTRVGLLETAAFYGVALLQRDPRIDGGFKRSSQQLFIGR